MKNKKRIICISIIGILLLFIIYIFYEPNIPYEEIPFEYAGSASGKLNMIVWHEAEDWADKEYVYNSFDGYFIIGDEEVWNSCAGEGACEFSDLDFEPQFEDNRVYVCTYGYQLKTLEYSTKKRTSWSKKYYNRATLWTDDYQEGTFYFYKIGEIGHELGNMLEDNDETADWFNNSIYGGK
ncbi:MAG: hypothetical protein HDR30_10650 [Lachnospiraceae bacterium]|nr:hypothetical protein [Lachnospiraceae bacterium]